MKKLLLLGAVALFFSGMATAQDDSKMWVGGSLAITSYSIDSDNGSSSFSIIPEFGYHLNSEWAVGGRIGINSNGTKVAGSKTSVNTTTLAPFARYTFSQMGDFSFFGQGELPLSFKDGNNTIGLRVLPGLTYSMGNWGIQAYLPAILSFESGDGYSNFALRANTNFLSGSSVGLIYKF